MNKNFGIVFLSILLGVCVVFIVMLENADKKRNQPPSQIEVLTHENDSLKVQLDSLRQEIFVKDIQLGRYEYIFDRAEEEFSDGCKKELDKMFQETE